MDKTPESLCEPAVRTRRAHKKSRHGCLGCKQRRKKCDERTPRCSRCKEGNFVCEYPTKSSKGLHVVSPSNLKPVSPRHSVLANTSSCCTSPSRSELHELPLGVSLSSIELDLLSHYLSHTARSIAFDNDDLYALQVGFPNLAFHSSPLMSSILALAAICKCHDIISENRTPSLEDTEHVIELLNLGDRHHSASLRQTRDEIPNPESYDWVLANAPLMVLFASASHSVRIRCAQWFAGSGIVPKDVMPEQSQWISLIRAAHLAYSGLLNAQTELGREVGGSPSVASLEDASTPASEGHGDIFPEDGPTNETRDLLLPILKATSGPALERLRSKAQAIYQSEAISASQSPFDGVSFEIEACLVALEVLHSIMDQVFLTNHNSSPITSTTNELVAERDSLFESQLSKVPPWLRDYLARVTSAAPPKPLRRVITSFLNQVPGEYLMMVQSTIDTVPGQMGDEDASSYDQGLLIDSPAHRLAMDIFAHWLVLMMLLDGVWWIGETGTWELGGVISTMYQRGWMEELQGNWWPESMHRVVTESKKYIIDR